jgi:hypothetical protein
MTPIKSPAGLVQYRRPALSFLANVGPPDAHATRRWSPCSGSHPPTRTGTEAVDRKMQFAPVGPTRQIQPCHIQEEGRLGFNDNLYCSRSLLLYNCISLYGCTSYKFEYDEVFLLRGEVKTWLKQKANWWK